MSSLTDHLLSLYKDEYLAATQHEFLKAAGEHSISKLKLEKWLTQDLLYAFVGYPKFISLLISKLSLRAPSGSSKKAKSLDERLLACFSGALANIVREIDFFKRTAEENGLSLNVHPDHHPDHLGQEEGKGGQKGVEGDLTGAVTKGYVDFMIATASTGTLEEALTLLWAMEKCYLDAWTYASSFQATATTNRTKSLAVDGDHGLHHALSSFIANWTSPEFHVFVKEICDLLDEVAERAGVVADLSGDRGGGGGGGQEEREANEVRKRCEEVWRWTLWYERRFWDGEL